MNSSIAPSDWRIDDALISWIDKQRFMHSAWGRYGSQNTADGVVDGFLVWSASTNDSNTQWTLRATIATPLLGNNPLNASNYECNLAKTNANWTSPWMPPKVTLSNWGDLTYGFMRGIEANEYGDYLQNLLNAMMIITGSGNHRGETLPSGVDASYGCVSTVTKVGAEIFVLLGTLFVVFLLLVVADLYALT